MIKKTELTEFVLSYLTNSCETETKLSIGSSWVLLSKEVRNTSLDFKTYEPVICIIVQGEKEIISSEEVICVSVGQTIIITHDIGVIANIADRVRTSCPPGGFNETTRDSFVSEVLWPWMELLSTHFKTYPFLFGNRPSLADVAIFGGAAAHFAQDPLCRRWCDEKGPYLVAHTHRLLENGAEFNERNLQERQWKSYDWDPTTNMSNSMMAILTDAGRLYLPWVSKACVDGEAVLEFKSGIKVNIKPTPFLMESRQIMLARYEKLKSPKLKTQLFSSNWCEIKLISKPKLYP